LAGWNDKMEIAGAPPSLRVSLRDRSGAALVGKSLLAHVARPATNRFDARLELAEILPGQYVAALPTPDDGAWIVDLSAFDHHGDDEPRYAIRRRLWIKR